MLAFKAFWLCALENGTTSAEDVWRGALEWALSKEVSVPSGYYNFYTDKFIRTSVIKKELGA